MANEIVGFIACIVSSALFGSYFLPIKKYDAGDGLFYQWVMCAAVFLVGLVVNLIQGCPQFYPLAMFGGALWCTANATCAVIIQLIGMGLGAMLWSVTNMMSGWASGRFGWFGLTPQVPYSNALNYAGVALSLVSAILFLFVDSSDSNKTPQMQRVPSGDDQISPKQLELGSNTQIKKGESELYETRKQLLESVSPTIRRIIGLCLALASGCGYGLTFTPITFMQNHRNDSLNYPAYVDATDNGLDYVFSYFTGIFLTSTLYFLIYCAIKRNWPIVNRQIILPAYGAGLMWAVGQALFLVANDNLSQAVTFPIITRMPGVIAVLWAVLLYKEITDRKNLIILGVASVVTVIAGIITGLSVVEI